jgi:hypothetical protein
VIFESGGGEKTTSQLKTTRGVDTRNKKRNNDGFLANEKKAS